MNLPFNDGEVAAGHAMVRYAGTEQWLTLGFDVVDEDNKVAAVFCRSLGYVNGEVSELQNISVAVNLAFF